MTDPVRRLTPAQRSVAIDQTHATVSELVDYLVSEIATGKELVAGRTKSEVWDRLMPVLDTCVEMLEDTLNNHSNNAIATRAIAGELLRRLVWEVEK